MVLLPAKDQTDGSFAPSRQISIANLVLVLAVFAVAILQSGQFKSPQPGARSGSQLMRVMRAAFHRSWAWLSSPGSSVPVALPAQQPKLRRWSVTDTVRGRSGNRRLGMHIPAA